jgi:hypothetical protein
MAVPKGASQSLTIPALVFTRADAAPAFSPLYIVLLPPHFRGVMGREPFPLSHGLRIHLFLFGMVHDLVDTFPRALVPSIGIGGTKDEPAGPPNGGRRRSEAKFRPSSFVVGQQYNTPGQLCQERGWLNDWYCAFFHNSERAGCLFRATNFYLNICKEETLCFPRKQYWRCFPRWSCC